MIFCDENWSSAAHNRSFPAQEVLLDASLFVPNQLCNPFELGRYVAWLVSQIDYHLNYKQALKAIKRALSLARITFLPEVTEEIKVFLETSSYVYEEEIKSIDRLISDISAIDESTYKNWIEALVEEKKALQRAKIDGRCQMSEKSLEDFIHKIRKRLADEYGDYPQVAA